jgi:hypothetical protein
MFALLPSIATVLVGLALSPNAHAETTCPQPNEPDAQIVENLVKYSIPPLTCPTLRKKFVFLNDAKDVPSSASFSFFRTAVPWYWDFLRRDRGCEAKATVRPEIQKVFRDFKGFCVGDAHPENFAIQYNPPPNPTTFGVNDPDDASKNCPVLGDFMRFLVASKIGASTITDAPPADLNALIDKYIASLSSPTPLLPSSKAYGKLLNKGEKGGDNDLPKGGSCPQPIFEKLSDSYRTLQAVNGFTLEPKPKPEDCRDLEGSKDSGGSGGLARYSIRFYNKKGDSPATPIVALFKQTQKNATTFYSDKAEWNSEKAVWKADDRYKTACLFERGPTARACPVVNDGDGRSFQVRTKYERAVKLDKVAPEDLQGLLEDEAANLGNLHGAHFSDPKMLADYITNLTALKGAIKTDSEALSAVVQKTAESLKKTLGPDGSFDATCAAKTAPVDKSTGFAVPKVKRNHSAAGAG